MSERYEGSWGLRFSEIRGACSAAYSAQRGVGYNFGQSDRNYAVLAVYERGAFRAITMQCTKSGKRIVAYAGTQFTSIRDWGNNALQHVIGIAPQYVTAMQIAQVDGNANTVLVGHSLGGGLASYASLATNVPAATINPAPLHLAAQAGTRLAGRNISRAQVVNYIAGGMEVLNLLDLSTPIVNRVGRDIWVESSAGDPIGKHSIDAIQM